MRQAPDLKPAKRILVETPDLSVSGEERARMTLACRDTDYLPRVKDAGKTRTVDGTQVQVMHNGLYVAKGAYQGDWQAKVIEGLKGNHEPQEEKVFNEVLKRVRPGSVMMELGCWWCYYSMWFLRSVKDGKAVCCEPDPDNLVTGRRNMQLNGFTEPEDFVFYEAAAGREDRKTISFTTESGRDVRVPIRTVDSLLKEREIDQLAILHMDIQGAELGALKGARKSLGGGKIRFLFVSTHHYLISGDPLIHQKCLQFILENGGHIVAEHTIAESCSGDGLIVASFTKEDEDFTVETSLQHSDDSLFRQPEKDVGLLWDNHDRLLDHGGRLQKDKEKLQGDLAEEKKTTDERRQELQWINRHPFKFLLGNLYHVHIRRDRSRSG
ncbi:MAG: FkbM family methyltransferase [Candidatus Saccharimonadales bacterium]